MRRSRSSRASLDVDGHKAALQEARDDRQRGHARTRSRTSTTTSRRTRTSSRASRSARLGQMFLDQGRQGLIINSIHVRAGQPARLPTLAISDRTVVLNRMLRYILKRLGLALITLWLLATIVFVIVSVLPGNVGRQVLGPFAVAGIGRSVQRTRSGTDKPLGQQYVTSLQEPGHARLRRVVLDWRRRHRQSHRPALFRSAQAGPARARAHRSRSRSLAGVFAATPQGHGGRPVDRDDRAGELVDARVRHRRRSC